MSLQGPTPADKVQVPPAAPPPDGIEMPKSFTFTLEDVNSVFGISAETLSALAESQGISEEQLIIKAITQLAKAEIPDLDLDAPRLSPEQLAQLVQRRMKVDEHRQTTGTTTLKDVFLKLVREEGDTDAPDVEFHPRNGGRG
jgi:hypothetical protein